MVVRWGPENDQLLLTLILETHAISVDGEAVLKRWPSDRGEKPTARAIKERVFKIRQNAAASGATSGNSDTTSAPAKANARGKTGAGIKKPATRAPKKTSTAATKGNASHKRKASTVLPSTEDSDEDSEDDLGGPEDVYTPSKRRAITGIKQEDVEQPGSSFPISPAATTPGGTAGDMAGLPDRSRSMTYVPPSHNLSQEYQLGSLDGNGDGEDGGNVYDTLNQDVPAGYNFHAYGNAGLDGMGGGDGAGGYSFGGYTIPSYTSGAYDPYPYGGHMSSSLG